MSVLFQRFLLLSSFISFKVWQYTNIIPGVSNLCLREKLCLTLEKLSQVHGRREFQTFPKCYILDGNTTQLNNLHSGYWLLRRAGSLRGSSEGLTILTSDRVASFLKKLQVTRSKPVSRKTLYQTRSLNSIEQYIHEPLLVNKRKHLLRFYLLIKSLDSLRVYISDFGDVAFSQMPYRANTGSQNESCMHLDIYTASWCANNMDSSSKAWNVNAPESLVWTLKYYWSILSHKNDDVSHTAGLVRDALLQTAILMASTSSDILNLNYLKKKPKYLALKKNG